LQGVSVNDSPLDGIKTKQVELGWRHTDGALDTQVAAFYSWSDKSIKYDSKTLAVLQQDTKKRNYGLEGQATYWLDDHWQVGVNGLAIRSQEKVDGRWLKQDVTSASPSKAGAFVGWKDDQRSLRLQGVRTFNLNDEPGNKIDGYALFDLLGTQALPVGTLTAGIQNLLDKDYTTVWGQRAQVYYGGLAPAGLFDYKGRGRTYSLTYSVEF
ncbi:TonB-dependent receptor domain-containing protein, partial [Pseudomonas aeruginosa]|jgi:iron complex outermembrane receptor protein